MYNAKQDISFPSSNMTKIKLYYGLNFPCKALQLRAWHNKDHPCDRYFCF